MAGWQGVGRATRIQEQLMVRALLLVLGLGLGAAGELSAQLSVVGLRNLAFGPVIQGINSSVPPSDPVRSGQFEIVVPAGTRVRVQFTVPNRLNGPAGARLNIQFGGGDAIALLQGPGSVPTTFNPRAPRIINMGPGSRLWVFLGGTVMPTGTQATGNYSNTVTLTVTVL
jgi:hypothetical protein